MPPDTTWVFTVKQLAGHGITDPALLVFIVNNCDIELPTGRFDMAAGFPKSPSSRVAIVARV